MKDQAERLRQMVGRMRAQVTNGNAVSVSAAAPELPAAAAQRARVIAVTSGKGGAGKSNFALNIACALHRLGRRVILMDADLSMANIDVLLGVVPRYHLGHVLRGERTVRELLYTAMGGVSLVAGGSGLAEMADLDLDGLARFVACMHELQDGVDYLMVDTSAGMSRSVLSFTLAADDVIVVTTPEPTAITDAYAVIKAMVRQQPSLRISLVVNQAQNPAEATEAINRLTATVLRFLGAPLEVLGVIPFDPQVPKAVRQQTPFILATPLAPAARAINQLARRIDGSEAPVAGLFFERLLRLAGRWQRPSP